jgi:hypothetical protein
MPELDASHSTSQSWGSMPRRMKEWMRASKVGKSLAGAAVAGKDVNVGLLVGEP